MQYIGEQLQFGQAGNLLIALSFAAALLGALAYYFHTRDPLDTGWKRIARWAFAVHAVSLTGIFVILYYLITNHHFEYYYVWQHSSTNLPDRYIFACFWEGQEGSFLLWAFWHIVLSLVVVSRAGKWEAPVMCTVMMVQVFLCSMVLGIYVGDFRIGSNPFVLLREHPDMVNLPFTAMPDYLQRINDGRGLNPLLQNYWMVIHPPVLFLGFASTLIPFAYAMGGLLTGKPAEWIKPAIGWTFFGVTALGTGILMGGAWAYEALSFGGFWAWDPVENASLVPWLTLVGAAHVMLIQQRKNESLLSSFLMCTATFILILYSTFLTRSGILGETSVHAFTDLGMSGQLLLYMAFFMVLAAVLIIKHRKAILKKQAEESMWSREFWMFIGMLVLAVSAGQITFSTSLPVINKLFGTNMAPPTKPVEFYNSIQIPIAVVICLLTGIGQFFKYRNADPGSVFRRLTLSLVLSVALTIAAAYWLRFDRVHYLALLFASLFSVVANTDYAIRFLKGRLLLRGASVAHVGVALIMLGALISQANSKVISNNKLHIDLGDDFPNNENIMLVKNDTLQMGRYLVTYSSMKKEGVNLYYTIDYLLPGDGTPPTHAFSLQPIVQLNERMGNVAEPATRHFLDKDIYTHITYAELEDAGETDTAGYDPEKELVMKLGDTTFASNSMLILKSLEKSPDRERLALLETDIAIAARIEIVDINKKKHQAAPVFVIRDQVAFTREDRIDALGLKIGFTRVDPTREEFTFTLAEKKSNKREFIIMKAIVFPFINILWIGCILMVVGTLMAVRKRTMAR